MNPRNRQRLWIACELYYPEDNTTGFYMTKLAEGLAPYFDVHALCGQPNYHRRGVRAPKRERLNDVEIFRLSASTLDKNVAWKKVINMITLSVAMFIGGLRRFRKGDRVLIVTAPPTILFTVGLAALLKGCTYTLLIHDNYPEMLVAAGTISRGSILEFLYNFLNRWLYKYTSKVIVVGRDMAETARKKVFGLDVPVAVIPNWAELESVHPTDRGTNPLLEQLDLTGKLVFLYAGNMGYPQDVWSIYDASLLVRDLEDVHFLFIGSGTKRRELEARLAADRPANITLLDPRPREEQNIFLNACDIAFVSLIKDMWGVSVPSRTYNLMAAGKPLLAIVEAGSEIDRIILEETNGWVVPPGDPAKLAEAIRRIYTERETLASFGQRSRSAAETKYSESAAIFAYREELS